MDYQSYGEASQFLDSDLKMKTCND